MSMIQKIIDSITFSQQISMLFSAHFLLLCKPKCAVSPLLSIPPFPATPSVLQPPLLVSAAVWEASVSSFLLQVLRRYQLCDEQE